MANIKMKQIEWEYDGTYLKKLKIVLNSGQESIMFQFVEEVATQKPIKRRFSLMPTFNSAATLEALAAA